jgi:hypothetical protein
MMIRWMNERFLSGFLFMAALAVYATTVCPTVSFTDNGELATAAATLGICHPTGYPLFPLLGRLAVMVPVSVRTILKLNALGALFTATASVLVFHLLLTLRRSVRLFGGTSPRGSAHVLSAFATALAFAFSTTVWDQATAIEVYGLHLVLAITTMIFLIRGMEEQLARRDELSRSLIMGAFALGMSFSNHMTTVLLAPAMLYLYFGTFGINAHSLKRVARLVPWFALGLSLYLCLPIRSVAQPPTDWGHPVTWERFIRHVSGSQYRVWMFSGAEVMKRQFAYFAGQFFSEFHWILAPVLLAGIIASAKRSRRWLLFVLLLACTTLLYATNYDIFDIDSYFLTAYIAVAMILAEGFGWLAGRIALERRALAFLGASAAAIGIIQIAAHIKDVDQSQNHLVEDYVSNLLESVPPGAMLVSPQWDYTVSPLVYLQAVEHLRPDLTVVDKNLLMNRSWYFLQLERNNPGIFRHVLAERDAFMEQLLKFERGEPFNPGVIQQRWDAFMGRFLATSMAERVVVVDPKVADELPRVGILIPDGLVQRLWRDSTYAPEPRPFHYRPWDVENVLTRDLKTAYLRALLGQAVGEVRLGRREEALACLANAVKVDSLNQAVMTVRNMLPR